MRTYEALYIISPELDDSAIQTVVADVERFITASSGTIVRSEVLGKRKLAYTIRKHTDGVYVVLRFLANPDSIKRLEQQLKLTESVIRYMVLYLDEKTLKLEEEQKRRYEEDLRLSSERRSRRDEDDDEDDDFDDDDDAGRRRGRDSNPRRRRSDDDAEEAEETDG